MASRSIATTETTEYLEKLKQKFPGPFEKAFIGILRFSLVFVFTSKINYCIVIFI